MSEATLDRLLILFSSGLALMVLGGLNFLLGGLSRRMRLVIGGSAATACTLAPLSIASAHVAAISFGLVLFAVGFLAAISTSNATHLFKSAMSVARRPSVHAAILVASGAVLMVGSLAHFTFEEEESFERDMAWMVEISARPPLHVSPDEMAESDLGHLIEMKTPDDPRAQSVVDQAEKQVLSQLSYGDRLIRVQPASDMCNCFGWVFTGGRFWLSHEDVELTLLHNDYQLVSDPRPGDVVIYRQGTMISHAAVVRTSGAGGPLLVEGKWGWMGVFLHRPDDSPYGKTYQFYRSSRHGHVLNGL